MNLTAYGQIFSVKFLNWSPKEPFLKKKSSGTVQLPFSSQDSLILDVVLGGKYVLD